MLSIRPVLYSASKAVNVIDVRDEPLGLEEGASPQTILTPAFISAVHRAFARGLH